MLKVSKRGKKYPGEEEPFALQLFDGLGYQSRPVDTFRLGPFSFIPLMLLFVLPMAFLVLGVRTPSMDQVIRWVNRGSGPSKSSAVSAPLPSVLVVTANTALQFDVTAIVEPRGYAAYCERTAKQGMDRLRTAPEQFKIVVVDDPVPGSSAMVHSIKQCWPDKDVIVLKGPRQPTSLAQSLLNFL